MIAMTPVLERGYTWWDRSLFPRDEFEERTRMVQKAMAEAGLDALVIWSQSYHTTGQLAYLSGWPMGGAVLVRREGEPTMFSPGGGREQYFARMQTWVEDMRSVPGRLGAVIAKTLAEDGVPGGRLGIVGYDQMSVGAYAEVVESLSGYDRVDFAETYAAVLAPKRPREVLAVRNSLTIAAHAVEAGVAAWEAGASNAEALVEAERIARIERARDFRGLVNSKGTELRPFERVSEARHDQLLLWIAIDQHGYWAESANGVAGTAATKAVDAMVATARVGATAGAVAEAALAVLPEAARDSALSYGLGAGVGLSLDEAPVIEPGNDALLVEGSLLSLKTYAKGASASIATATVKVGAEGATRIVPN
ncbi:M24 family metallopeptidase [Sphingomonas sp. MMS24-J13]|uniref:M24 family metallopeptidase n=1 Tax=Sphingomonas sp. MMS24-J13 TaxID=3238686 RepID=UPI00384D6623